MKQHSPETRAAVLAALAAGESVNRVSQQFGVSRRTISGWRDQAQLPTVAQQKKVEIGQKVYELLEDYIETLRVQVRVTRDEAWIKKQTAGELAILHGVLSDKSVRLLAAFRPGTDDPGGTG
jgi:transposase-like protein